MSHYDEMIEQLTKYIEEGVSRRKAMEADLAKMNDAMQHIGEKITEIKLLRVYIEKKLKA